MAGRAYTTTTIFVMGVKVEVRQPLFKGVNRVPEQVGELVKRAKTWVALTICNLSQQGFMRDVANDQGLVRIDGNAFRHCFLDDANVQNVNTIKSKLGMTSAGLSRTLGVKVRHLNDAHGKVTPYYPMSQTAAPLRMRRFGKCSMFDGDYWYDKDGDIFHSKGEIKMKTDSIWNVDFGTQVLIHEATHKFANTRDHASFDDAWQHYDKPLTAQQALENADSYARFAFLSANKTRADRAIRRAESASIDALDGVAGLFK